MSFDVPFSEATMSRSRCWSLLFLVLGVVALTNPGSVRAQPRSPQNEDPSYKNLPEQGGALIDLWKKRKGAVPKTSINQEMLKSLIKQFGNLKPQNIDPALVKDFIKNNPLFQDKDRLNDFKDFLEEFMDKNQGNDQPNPFQNLNPDKLFGDLKAQQKQWEQLNPQPFNQGQGEPRPKRNDFIKQNAPPPLPKEGQKIVNGLEGMFKDLGEGDALKDLVKGLTDLNSKGANGWDNGLPKWLPDMGKFGVEDFADWGKKLGNMNIDFPRLDFQAPNFGGGGGGGLGGGFGGFGSGGGGGSSGGSVSLGDGGSLGNLWILPLLIGGGIVVWLLLQKYREMERKPAVATVAKLPPMDPNDIRTRQDLVEAFDRLSVQKYGETARVWNHRTIGGKLENTAPEAQTEAAHELTGLYEYARYLPVHEDMTEQQLSRARQHLRTLAEVGST